MNYQKHYDLLMKKAQSRAKPEGYTERHHIVPRHAGGSDDSSNLVHLTAREHFIAHYLRAKAFKSAKDYKSLLMFKSGRYVNSRLYAIARLKTSQSQSDKMKNLSVTNPNEYKKVRDAIAESLKKPETRKKFKESRANYILNSNFSEDHSNRIKSFINTNPEKFDEMQALSKAARQTDSFKTKRSSITKGQMLDPSMRYLQAKMIVCNETGNKFNSSTDAANWLISLGHAKASGSKVRSVARGAVKSMYGYTFSDVS